MRYPAGQKSKTHEKIVDAASRSFREHGSEGQGIASLMKDLGLTHGGFYRHFESKDDLYVDAVTAALQKGADRFTGVMKAAPKGGEVRALIDYYLSAEHLNEVGGGCVMAALAPEISRQPTAVRRGINATMKAFSERIIPFLPGASKAEKRRNFYVLFPGMAGVLMMARAIADPAVRNEMLSAAKRFYKEAFARQK